MQILRILSFAQSMHHGSSVFMMVLKYIYKKMCTNFRYAQESAVFCSNWCCDCWRSSLRGISQLDRDCSLGGQLSKVDSRAYSLSSCWRIWFRHSRRTIRLLVESLWIVKPLNNNCQPFSWSSRVIFSRLSCSVCSCCTGTSF